MTYNAGTLSMAMEWGYRACERGVNIQQATAEFQNILDGQLSDQGTDPLEACTAPPRQESDEYVCTQCPLRWDIHEERPPCLGRR